MSYENKHLGRFEGDKQDGYCVHSIKDYKITKR